MSKCLKLLPGVITVVLPESRITDDKSPVKTGRFYLLWSIKSSVSFGVVSLHFLPLQYDTAIPIPALLAGVRLYGGAFPESMPNPIGGIELALSIAVRISGGN